MLIKYIPRVLESFENRVTAVYYLHYLGVLKKEKGELSLA